MCPKTVIPCCDTETSSEVVCYSPDGSLQLERNEEGTDAAIERDHHNESDVEPIDMLVPIRLGDRFLCDVFLLGIIFRFSIWL